MDSGTGFRPQPKPVKKQPLVIFEVSHPEWYVLRFFADDDVADAMREFGAIIKLSGEAFWSLEVDRRYDFKEVQTYLESFA